MNYYSTALGFAGINPLGAVHILHNTVRGGGVGGFVTICYVGEGGSEPLLRNGKKCQRTKRHVKGKG